MTTTATTSKATGKTAKTTLRIKKARTKDPLLFIDGCRAQKAFICLNCEKRELYGDYMENNSWYDPNTVPEYMFWRVNPYIGCRQLNRLLDEIAPLAREIIDGYSGIECVDVNDCYGKFSAAAREAADKIKEIIYRYSNDD